MDETVIRQRLIEERSRLSSTAGQVADEIDVDETEQSSLGELSSIDQHPADHASETFEREKDLTILGSIGDQVDEIDAALERLDNGTYGKCESCGKPIGDDRLEARPASRFCIEDAEAGAART